MDPHTLACLQRTTGEITFAAERLLICNLLNDTVSTQIIKRRKTGWEWITNWAPGPVWMVAKRLEPTGIGSRDRPACSNSRYRLRCPGPLKVCSRLFRFPVYAPVRSGHPTCRTVLRTYSLTWNLEWLSQPLFRPLLAANSRICYLGEQFGRTKNFALL
jgi:hypothetical protein